MAERKWRVHLRNQRRHLCLCHGKEIPFTQDETGIKISLPEDLEKEADTIVTLELSEEVKLAENQEIHFTGKQ